MSKRKAIIALAALLSVILVSVNIIISKSETNQSVTGSTKQASVTTEDAENRYIQSTHESVSNIDEAIQKLKEQLSDINIDDSGWRVTTRFAFDDLSSAETTYSTAESILSTTDEKEKYTKTITEMDKGIEQIKHIYADGQNAVDNYDKKKLEEIAGQLSEANTQMKKGLAQLETDRYAE